MTIEEQVSKGIMAAMKTKDTIRLEVLRNIKRFLSRQNLLPGLRNKLLIVKA